LVNSESKKHESSSDSSSVQIYIKNGKLASSYNPIKGLKIELLSSAWEKGLVDASFFQEIENTSNPFYNLGQAFLLEGLYIEVDSTFKSNELIEIKYSNSELEQSPMCHPQTIIKIKENASCQLWEDYTNGPGKRWTNAITKISIDPGAKLTHIKSSETKSENWHMDQTLVRVDKKAEYRSTVFFKDLGLSRNELRVALVSEDSKAELNGLYMPKGNGHNDNYTLINHKAPRSYSSQLYKGILEDDSMAVFAGTVKVDKNCPGVDSVQMNKNLLLSKKTRIESQPQLLIQTDDVKCAHGSTIGQLNEDELFYLQTRGIPSCRSFEMLATAFAEEILLGIENDYVRHHLEKKIQINSIAEMENMHV
jgi:Fe-S cluster assembly protein SufD